MKRRFHKTNKEQDMQGQKVVIQFRRLKLHRNLSIWLHSIMHQFEMVNDAQRLAFVLMFVQYFAWIYYISSWDTLWAMKLKLTSEETAVNWKQGHCDNKIAA